MKAQEIFDCLGWSRNTDGGDSIVYENTVKTSQILFNLETKKVNIESIQENNFLGMQEIDAISTQCKELGWF